MMFYMIFFRTIASADSGKLKSLNRIRDFCHVMEINRMIFWLGKKAGHLSSSTLTKLFPKSYIRVNGTESGCIERWLGSYVRPGFPSLPGSNVRQSRKRKRWKRWRRPCPEASCRCRCRSCCNQDKESLAMRSTSVPLLLYPARCGSLQGILMNSLLREMTMSGEVLVVTYYITSYPLQWNEKLSFIGQNINLIITKASVL